MHWSCYGFHYLTTYLIHTVHYVVLWWHKFFKGFVKAIFFPCVQMAHEFNHQVSNNKNNINKKKHSFPYDKSGAHKCNSLPTI